MVFGTRFPLLPALAVLATSLACGEPIEAARVELPVFIDSTALTEVTTDIGYVVTLTEARIMVEDLTFSTAGKTEGLSLWQRASGLFLPSAHAHPGHAHAGEVTGELRGRFLLSWAPGGRENLGVATLLAGSYTNAGFTFAHATSDDGLPETDPLVGHTAVLRGNVARNETTYDFIATVDAPLGRKLEDAPFFLDVNPGNSEQLGLRLLPHDLLEGGTLFDGIDFEAVSVSGHVTLTENATEPGNADAYYLLRRRLLSHAHFSVVATP